MRRIAIVFALAGLLGGCGKPAAEKPLSTLTEAQRDSVLAKSDLPGAVVVDRALKVSGQEATRATGMDSLTK